VPRLREKHGAELAGADQSNGDRPAGAFALDQLCVEIHLASSWSREANTNAVSGTSCYWQSARETKV
jgi:hypothetical protein